MIGRQIKGKGFRGLLDYLDKKEGAEIVAGTVVGRSPRAMAAEFGAVRRLKPTLGRAVFHMPVRPAPGESLSVEQWREVAERIAAGMGFSSSPWVAYLHRDAREVHLHLVASRVTYDGRVVSDSRDYERGMKVLRAIERDYGLSLGPPTASDRKPPRRSELARPFSDESPSMRVVLQRAIEAAARDRPAMPLLFARLAEQGIRAVPRLTSTGQVLGLSYSIGDSIGNSIGNSIGAHAFAGSSLGRAFTWPGLQRRLGVRYLESRDHAAIVRAAALAFEIDSPLDPSSPYHSTGRRSRSQEALAMSDPQASTRTTPLSEPNTAVDLAVRRQRRALELERFDLLLVDSRTGATEARNGWGIAQLEKSLGWLRHRSAEGVDVLIRPVEPSRLAVVGDLPEKVLPRLREADLQPALVLRTAKVRSEAWFLHREELSRAEARAASAAISRRLGLHPPREISDYGHLAGFAAHLAAQRGEAARVVSIERSPSRVYGEEARVVAEVRGQLGRGVGEQLQVGEARARGDARERSAARYVEDELARAARDPLERLPLAEKIPAGPALDRSMSDLAAARDRLLEVRAVAPPADGLARLEQEAALVAAYRGFRERERRLEDALGLRPLPTHLSSSDLGELAVQHSQLVESRQRFEVATDRAALVDRPAAVASREEARLALGVIEERFARFAEGVRYEAIEPSRLGEIVREAPVISVREAPSLESSLGLEERVADLSRAVRAATFEREAIAVRLDALATSIEPNAPLAAHLRLSQVSSEFAQVDRRVESLHAALATARGLAVERDLERIGAQLAVDPTRDLLREQAERIGERARLVEQLAGRDATFDSLPLSNRSKSAEIESARAGVEEAARRVLEEPSATHVAAHREAVERLALAVSRTADREVFVEFREAKLELRRAVRELRPDLEGKIPEDAAARWARALARFEVAEDALAGRLPREARRVEPLAVAATAARLESPRSESYDATLHPLLEAVRRGDHTPATLDRLERALGPVTPSTPSTRATRASSPLEPRSIGAKEPLLAAVERYRDARREFLQAVRAERLAPRGSDRGGLRESLDRYRGAQRELHALAERHAPEGAKRCLALEALLARPEYRLDPHKAVSAWAVEQARRGTPVAALRAQIHRWRDALPLSLGGHGTLRRSFAFASRFSLHLAWTAARFATRVAARRLEQLIHER